MKLVGSKLLSSLILIGHLSSARSFHLGSRIRALGKSPLVNTPFPDSKQNIITRRMATVSNASKTVTSVNEAAKHNFTWQSDAVAAIKVNNHLDIEMISIVGMQ